MKRLLLALMLAACGGGGSSATAPHDPADRPPLPPASGTPVGYLVDGATDLHLRDDQVTKLKEIDSTLSSELDEIDTKLRSASPPPPQASASSSQGMGMGGRGGRRGGGGRHRGGGGGNGSAAPVQHGDPAAANRLSEERREDVKHALEQAFAILDDDQKPAAKKLLQDHDVDLDDDKPAAAPTTDDGSVPEN
jgi:hypothetical protein